LALINLIKSPTKEKFKNYFTNQFLAFLVLDFEVGDEVTELGVVVPDELGVGPVGGVAEVVVAPVVLLDKESGRTFTLDFFFRKRK